MARENVDSKLRSDVLRGDHEISLQEFQKQLVLQNLFPFLDFLEANSIPYVLGFGTLLGAVREKGMIPWDFDVDLWMPEKALLDHLSELDEYAKSIGSTFQTYTRNECSFGLSRIMCPNLYVARPSMKENPFHQAYIDIFVYRKIQLPKDIEREKRSIQRRIMLSLIKYDRDPSKNMLKNVLKNLIRPFLPGDFNKWMRRRMNQSKWNIPGEITVVLRWACIIRRNYPKLSGVSKISFENRLCFVPANFIEFLTAEYGSDFMIPTDDMRSAGASFWSK